MSEIQKRTKFSEYSKTVRSDIKEHIIKALIQNDLWDNVRGVPGYGAAMLDGKHLRGCLLMLVFDSLASHERTTTKQGNLPLPPVAEFARDAALDLAAALQIAHGASLIVDDMLDEDIIRRGKPAHHATVGQKQAMLDTVDALGAAYHLVSSHGFDYVSDLASVQRSMVSGVLREAVKQHKVSATSLYTLMITQKTGLLFSLAGKWGAQAACTNKSVVSDFEKYGLNVGLAMQIADDITDISRIGNGGKISGFGSEMFLLRCLTVDSLAKEVVEDIKSRDMAPAKIKYFMSQKGVARQLDLMLQDKIADAEYIAYSHKPICASSLLNTLAGAPAEIVQMMKNE